MLLKKKTTIEEFLVSLLSTKSNLSVNEILSSAEERHLDFSQRGIYKELKKLEHDGIILKTGKTYNLDLSWIIQSSTLIERAYKTYSDPKYLEKTLSITDKKVVHNFSDLLRMDHYWVQVLIALQEMMPHEPLYLWCPYQWFNLIQNYNIDHFYTALERKGTTRYHIMGGDNFLNRKALESLPKNGHYSFEPGEFAKEMSVYYSVVGDYLIKVTIDRETMLKIEDAFSVVRNERDFRGYNFNQIFRRKVKARVVVERSEGKARGVRGRVMGRF